MRLKVYVIGICSLVVIFMTGFLFLELTKVFDVRSQEIDAIHRAAVIQFARTLLEAKAYLLSTYREQIDSGNHLSKKYLLSLGSGRFEDVKQEIFRFQKRTGADFADLVYVTTGKALFTPSLGREKGILSLTKDGGSGIRFAQVGGKLVLLSFSPLKLYHDPIAMVVLGYFLNSGLRDEVFKATKTRVEFLPSVGLAGAQANILTIRDQGSQLLTLNLSIEGTAIEGINERTKRELIAAGGISLVLLGFLLYFLLELGLLRGLKRVFSDVQKGADALGSGVMPEPVQRSFSIREVTSLSEAFFRYGESLKDFHEKVEQKTRVESIGEFAGAMAHSLKGMVKGLEALFHLEKVSVYTSEEKQRITNYFKRIRGLSTETLEKLKTPRGSKGSHLDFSQSNEAPSIEMVWTVVDGVVAQKAAEYAALKHVSLDLAASPELFSAFAKVQSGEFKSTLCDLVDNAVEALGTRGDVSVSLCLRGEQIVISILDDGCGIPAHARPRLFARCASYGKPTGTGLGLWRARERLNAWGGSISIPQSELGSGTTVEVCLPKVEAPRYYISQLIIPTGSAVIILDDDEEVHNMWKERLSEGLGQESQIEIHHFQKAEQLFLWKRNQGLPAGDLLFLCDFEFPEENWNGLQVIEELELSRQSILVTWHFEDPALRAKCEKEGIRLLPKSLVGFVPIETRKGSEIALPERGRA